MHNNLTIVINSRFDQFYCTEINTHRYCTLMSQYFQVSTARNILIQCRITCLSANLNITFHLPTYVGIKSLFVLHIFTVNINHWSTEIVLFHTYFNHYICTNYTLFLGKCPARKYYAICFCRVVSVVCTHSCNLSSRTFE